jgi:hypothetical protein
VDLVIPASIGTLHGDGTPRPTVGIVITNRDRVAPLAACLLSLAAQDTSPAWVALADLGSSTEAASHLARLARRYGVSYLRVEHTGRWNQALAFNTALRHMPATSHVIQLDADMILHPALLRITIAALARCDALAAVPSYVPAAAVPVDYAGTEAAFRALAAQAVGGHPYSRGGFMVVARDWLFAHGAYDEAYVEWGFEDADLWCRIGATAAQYCEGSGSFLLHQSHPRQAGVADAANPNRARYAARLRDPTAPVNPFGWGAAPVTAAEIRYGIISHPVGRPEAESIGFIGAPVRTQVAGRLRPAAVSTPCSVAPSPGPLADAAISVILLVKEPDPLELAAALRGLSEQRHPPREITVADCGSTAESARASEGAVRRTAASHIVWQGGSHAKTPPQALNAALQRLDPSSRCVLILGGPQWLGPDALTQLGGALQDGRSFLHGAPHAIPPIARDLDLLEVCRWPSWASIASIDPGIAGWWHFAEAGWLARHGLYDQRLGRGEWPREAVWRAARAGGALAWPGDWVISLACTRRVSLAPPAGSAEAVMAGSRTPDRAGVWRPDTGICKDTPIYKDTGFSKNTRISKNTGECKDTSGGADVA